MILDIYTFFVRVVYKKYSVIYKICKGENLVMNLAEKSGYMKNGNKFQYITDTSELYSRFMEQRNDMRDAIQKQIDRDRYIVNKNALIEYLYNGIIGLLENNLEGMANDISEYVVSDVVGAIKGITEGNPIASSSKGMFRIQLARGIGKMIANAPFDYFDDLIK